MNKITPKRYWCLQPYILSCVMKDYSRQCHELPAILPENGPQIGDSSTCRTVDPRFRSKWGVVLNVVGSSVGVKLQVG